VRGVYAGTDPLTGREIRFRKTCKTERAAQIELGKLREHAAAGRQPDTDVTVAQLLDQYVSTVEWDMSARESNLEYIRRTIKPAIGATQVRKVRSRFWTPSPRLPSAAGSKHRQAGQSGNSSKPHAATAPYRSRPDGRPLPRPTPSPATSAKPSKPSLAAAEVRTDRKIT